jgi:hypothetical protein
MVSAHPRLERNLIFKSFIEKMQQNLLVESGRVNLVSQVDLPCHDEVCLPRAKRRRGEGEGDGSTKSNAHGKLHGNLKSFILT